jgi:hypothetical protein
MQRMLENMFRIYGSIFTVLLSACAALAQPFTISTFAGAPLGSGKLPAVKAILGESQGLAIDAAGNLYFNSLNSIFQVNAAGILVRVAGNLQAGYLGDSGTATQIPLSTDPARPSSPIGIAIDHTGNVFVADPGNRRIRKIPAGVISTVAQVDSIVGLAVDGAGDIYFTGDCSLRMLAPAGAITLLAGDGYCADPENGILETPAALDRTSGLTIDGGGNLFFAERYRVRKLDPAGNLTVAAGNGTKGYSGDGGPAANAQLSAGALALDSSGNLYIADYEGHAVRKVSVDGMIATVLSATASGLALDAACNLYFAAGSEIWMASPDGTVRVVAGGGDGGDGQFNFVPWGGGMAADMAGGVYVADTGTQRIRKISADGTVNTVAGMTELAGFAGDGNPAVDARLYDPTGVAASAAGNLYIGDTYKSRVREVNSSGVISTIGGAVAELRAIALDGNGNVYTTDECGGHVRRIAPDGTVTVIAGKGGGGQSNSGDGGPAIDAGIGRPWSLAAGGLGNLYIGDMAHSKPGAPLSLARTCS